MRYKDRGRPYRRLPRAIAATRARSDARATRVSASASRDDPGGGSLLPATKQRVDSRQRCVAELAKLNTPPSMFSVTSVLVWVVIVAASSAVVVVGGAAGAGDGLQAGVV